VDLASIAAAALRLALTLLLPALLASLVVSLALAAFELMTQGQDAQLSFVPRLFAVALALFLGHELMSAELVAFTGDVFRTIALVAR